MTTQSLPATQPDASQPTAEDLAHATPLITIETILVCGGVTALLAIVFNVIGLIVGLGITALVIHGNAQVRQFSIQNAVDDRLEKEGTR